MACFVMLDFSLNAVSSTNHSFYRRFVEVVTFRKVVLAIDSGLTW